jgi:hypothetical protein
LIVFLAELAVGYYVNHVNKMIMGDALSRVANAYYVLYIEPPHLASIGFVWNPLPSFLELPFMFLHQIYKPIASSALAGVIITAAFTAGTAVLIYKNCRYFKISPRLSLLFTALYCVNPFVFIYGFNGMSEAVFIFTIIFVVTEFIQWMEDEAQIHLLTMGIAMALAFLTRYEAIPLCAAIFTGVSLVIFRKRNQRFPNFLSAYHYLEGTSIVIFTPVITAVILWLLSNYIIMGDPLYFLHSVYSNEAQSMNIQNPEIIAVIGHPIAAIIYEIKGSLVFLPVFVFVMALRVWTKRFLTRETLILLLLVIAIPALHYIMLLIGSSYGWLRFYVYTFPIAFAWLPYEISKAGFIKLTLKPLVTAFGVLIMVFAAVMTGVVMVNPKLASEENSTYRQTNQNLVLQGQIAKYINANFKNEKILMDSFLTFEVVLELDNTDRIITSCSYEFRDAVASPKLYGVQYILAVKDEGLGKLDAINIQYPDLYRYGATWCTLVKDFNGYELFQVN